MDALPPHATPDLARRMMSCSPAFAAQRCATAAEQTEVLAAVAYLCRMAPRPWIAGRVAGLLGHYFASHQDDALATAVAEDWCVTLAAYPAWAIAEACHWWVGRENLRKHCKPLPGDIADRAHALLAPLRAAAIMAAGSPRPPAPDAPDQGPAA